VASDELHAEHAFSVQETAAELLIDYSMELTMAILEEASIIAQHRLLQYDKTDMGGKKIDPPKEAKEINEDDVNLVLIKKLNLRLPPVDGQKVARVALHKETLCVQSGSARWGDKVEGEVEMLANAKAEQDRQKAMQREAAEAANAAVAAAAAARREEEAAEGGGGVAGKKRKQKDMK